MRHPARKWFSIIIALIMIAIGILPLLNMFNMISFDISFITSTTGTILSYILAAGALGMIIDSLFEGLQRPGGIFTLILGLILLILGILPILGIGIAFISVILIPTVYYVLFTIEGVILLIDTFSIS
jgi:hypothetical protein